VWDAIRVESQNEDLLVSLLSRLREAVAGQPYLDDQDGYDDDYDYVEGLDNDPPRSSGAAITRSDMPSFGEDPFAGTNVIGMPGLHTPAAEVFLMEPRSFDEMIRAIQALRDRKTVIINLSMMEPDQAQRAVDFVAGGTFALDGHQERVGDSIFLFAPSCVTVSTATIEDSTSPTITTQREAAPEPSAPSPAWSRQDAVGFGG
jgi:cell division inhibitor SepF